jgi:ABC-2 type transport system permease protein
MTIAGVVLKRDRLMGIGQMITMPLCGLLIHWPAHLLVDFGVLTVAAVVGVGASSALVGRLAR